MAKNNWYAIFSHTGSEIINIQKMLKIKPTEIWTSNRDYAGNLPAIFGDRYSIESRMLEVATGSVITLNGYRRLISSQTLRILKDKGIKVINIHPAPICLNGYEDLRGIDPHVKYYNGYVAGKYTLLGVTIHEVDDGIDTGKALYMSTKLASTGMDYDMFVNELHNMGTEAWIACLPELLDMEV